MSTQSSPFEWSLLPPFHKDGPGSKVPSEPSSGSDPKPDEESGTKKTPVTGPDDENEHIPLG